MAFSSLFTSMFSQNFRAELEHMFYVYHCCTSYTRFTFPNTQTCLFVCLFFLHLSQRFPRCSLGIVPRIQALGCSSCNTVVWIFKNALDSCCLLFSWGYPNISSRQIRNTVKQCFHQRSIRL